MRAPLFIASICGCLAIAFGQSTLTEQQNLFNQVIANPRDSLAHYNLVEFYFDQKNYMISADQYREALHGNLEPRWVEAWSHIGLGKVYDFIDQHDRAVREYQQAATSSDEALGARHVAEAYLKNGANQSDKPLLTLPALFRTPLHIFLTEPVTSTEPEYSEEARAAGLEGTVFVDFSIAADGTPTDPRVRFSLSPGFGLDEKALEAVSHWRFAPHPSEPAAKPALVGVNFLLPSKLSRWHLVYASFQAPEGATRPVFLTENYPLGSGISVKAIDEGAVMSSIRRFATVTLQFDVDESGRPANFDVLASSAPVWGPEAVAVASDWRFKPGTKDGKPIAVPCTLDLIWGQKAWSADSLEKMRTFMSGAEQHRDMEAGVDLREVSSVREIGDGASSTAGSVVLAVLIDEHGIPLDVRVVRGLNIDLDAKAVRAARAEHFKPALLNGVGIPITISVEVTFR